MIFEHRKRKSGARTIKMILERSFWQIVNLKKVRRIMKKYNLKPVVRKKSKYRSLNFGDNHKVLPNLVNRKFNVSRPDRIYSSDITYLPYGKGQRAYMSAIKDLGTNEIKHFHVASHMTLPLATTGLEATLKTIPISKRKKLIIHTDQGGHYTSKSYRKILKNNGVKQSMSRKGNCLDNSPIESFFGHMKDEIELQSCQALKDVQRVIKEYVSYYNNERPQWGLNGKTPVEYRGSS